MRPRSIVSALMRRQAWETVGGFPEHLRSAEDLLFMSRVEQSGFADRAHVAGKGSLAHSAELLAHLQALCRILAQQHSRGSFSEWQQTIFRLLRADCGDYLRRVFHGPARLIFPPIAWLLLLIARAAKTLYQNRQTYPAGFGRNLARLALLGANHRDP